MESVADDTLLVTLMTRVQAGDPEAYEDLLDDLPECADSCSRQRSFLRAQDIDDLVSGRPAIGAPRACDLQPHAPVLAVAAGHCAEPPSGRCSAPCKPECPRGARRRDRCNLSQRPTELPYGGLSRTPGIETGESARAALGLT